MPATKVIVVGCGIAGPVLAIFLKMKGYEPVVFQSPSFKSQPRRGVSLQPNGLRVLSLIPGLVPKIVGRKLSALKFVSLLPEDEGILTESGVAASMERYFGQVCVRPLLSSPR